MLTLRSLGIQPVICRSLRRWINDFSAVVEAAQPPVLVYECEGRFASFLALAHLAKTTGISTQEVLDRGASLGYHFCRSWRVSSD